MPRIRKEATRSLIVLLFATGMLCAAIFLIADGVTGFSRPIDDHLLFIVPQIPLLLLAGLILQATHDRLTRPRFRILVMFVYCSMLILPAAIIREMEKKEVEGPALFGVLLMSSMIAAPFVGLAAIVPVLFFRVVDWKRRKTVSGAESSTTDRRSLEQVRLIGNGKPCTGSTSSSQSSSKSAGPSP